MVRLVTTSHACNEGFEKLQQMKVLPFGKCSANFSNGSFSHQTFDSLFILSSEYFAESSFKQGNDTQIYVLLYKMTLAMLWRIGWRSTTLETEKSN